MERTNRTENILVGLLTSFIVAVLFAIVAQQWSQLRLMGLIIAGVGVFVFLMTAVTLVLLQMVSVAKYLVGTGNVELDDVKTHLKDHIKDLDKELADAREAVAAAREHAAQFYSLSSSLLGHSAGKSADTLILSLEQLTEFEESIPHPANVVIDRPSSIGTKVTGQITKVMKANADRGVKYSVIGHRPSEWGEVAGIEELVPRDAAVQTDASLILPRFGMVLYIVGQREYKKVKGNKKGIWIEVQHVRYNPDPVFVRGFALVPLTGEAEHGYFAIPLSKPDIDQLVHRIW